MANIQPSGRSVRFRDVLPTLYKWVGVDAREIRNFDQAGVRQHLIDPGNGLIHQVV